MSCRGLRKSFNREAIGFVCDRLSGERCATLAESPGFLIGNRELGTGNWQ